MQAWRLIKSTVIHSMALDSWWPAWLVLCPQKLFSHLPRNGLEYAGQLWEKVDWPAGNSGDGLRVRPFSTENTAICLCLASQNLVAGWFTLRTSSLSLSSSFSASVSFCFLLPPFLGISLSLTKSFHDFLAHLTALNHNILPLLGPEMIVHPQK